MRQPRLLVALAVLALSGGLRFVRLGEWSFAGDEVASVQEAQALHDGADPGDNPITRLPRMTPLGVAIHGASYRTLGHTEFAARFPAAVAGALLCGLAVLGLWTTLGGWSATAVGLLLALNPECLFYSQYNRYYSIGLLLAAASILAAIQAVRLRSESWMIRACLLALFGLATHLLLGGLLVGLFAVALLASGATRKERYRLALVVSYFGLAFAIVGYFYLRPLVQGWNAGAGWGYSLPRAVLGGVNQLGLPTTLLAVLGAVLMLACKHPLRWVWAVWAVGWIASLVVLPKLVAFHPGYSFLFLFGPIVLAGYAVGVIAEKLAESRGKCAAALWLGVAVLSNAPPLVSHYADGSRPDFRAASHYVARQRGPDDTIAAVSPGNLAFYSPVEPDRLNPDRLMDGFRIIAEAKRPCWIVVLGGRTPRDGDVQNWLNENCRLKASFRKPRFDYYDFSVDVYYFEPR